MKPQPFSYTAEKEYYSQHPVHPGQPYLHLEPYLTCWFDPVTMLAGKRILDVGAGECLYSQLIAERFSPRMVVATDLLVDRLRPSLPANTPIRVVAGDCYRLPFRAGSFDVVFGSLVLHRPPDLPSIAAEVRRVLVAGGAYVGFEPNYLHAVNLYRHYLGGDKYKSRNVYPLWPRLLRRGFESQGFKAELTFFYAPRPRWRFPLLGTCVGVVAVL